MPKPFSLQSPETIAKEYGGNKQKIAQAMQMGIVDPTAGTLAGMFIDRMRGAQMQEAASPPTVAQQIFAPPAPPMGAPPMGGGMPPAPPMGGGMPPAPPMGGGMPPAPPMGAPPMGMADGGLAALPIPDAMFDEPTNGGFDDGYANGGVVAFADAGLTSPPEPDNYHGMSTDAGTNLGTLQSMLNPETEFSSREAEYIRNILSAEGQKKRRDEDKWFALAQMGATMASTPGSLLQAASAGINKALPGMQEAARARRAEEREALTAGASREIGRNKEQRELASAALGMVEKAGGFAEAAKTREFQDKWNRMDDNTRRYIGQLSANATLGAAKIQAASYTGVADKQAAALDKQARNDAMAAALKDVAAATRGITPKTPQEKANADRLFNERFNFYYRTYLGAPPTGAPSPAGVGGYGAPPPGAVKRVG